MEAGIADDNSLVFEPPQIIPERAKFQDYAQFAVTSCVFRALRL